MKNIFLILLLIIAFILSLLAGKVWIAPADWFADNAAGWIMAELRLPRAILGASIGTILGLSGAVLQGYVRNPLADPTIIGVSSSAALGGVLAIFFGLSAVPFAIFGCAMMGAAASLLLLVIIAGNGRGPLGFILGGMILSTLSGAPTAFLISIAPNPFATSEIINWLMGALTDRSMDDGLTALPWILAGGLILYCTGPALNALALGEDGARSLGIDLKRLQYLVVLGCCIGVGASVAVSGVVGFVGLIVPHVMRQWIGARPSDILIPSALGGAILMLAADSMVRILPGVNEVRLGIVMALLGAPFFFIIMMRRRAEWVS